MKVIKPISTIIILILLAFSGNLFGKTLTRSCSGFHFAKYKALHLNITTDEIYISDAFRAEGRSKGIVPSPTKARHRACMAAFSKAKKFGKRVWKSGGVKRAICAKHPNSVIIIKYSTAYAKSKGVGGNHPYKNPFYHEFKLTKRAKEFSCIKKCKKGEYYNKKKKRCVKKKKQCKKGEYYSKKKKKCVKKKK